MLELAEYQGAVANDPQDADAHYNLAVALDEMGQRNEAMAEWQEAVRLDVQHWQSYIHLAGAYADQAERHDARSDWQKSCRAYRQALAIKMHDSVYDAGALRMIGYLEWKFGYKLAAMETLKAALQEGPEEEWTYNTLGWMQARMGHWKGMVQTAKALVELPSYKSADFRLCLRCTLSIAAVLVAATVGVISLYKTARR